MQSFGYLVTLAFALTPRAAGRCGVRRDCNAPFAFTNIQFASDAKRIQYASGIQVKTSDGVESDTLYAVSVALDMMRNMIGTVDRAKIFVLEPDGPHTNYGSAIDDFCLWTSGASNTQALRSCTWASSSWLSGALGGGGESWVSTTDSCTCNEWASDNVYATIAPTVGQSLDSIKHIAVHEYTHMVQKASGGPMPTWLMEGGAMFNQCLMAKTIGDYQSFSDCFRSTTLPAVINLYEQDPTVKWFQVYANDRCCGNDCPSTHGDLGSAYDEGLYYDLGSFATAMAIARATAASGRGAAQTITDFWTSIEHGFWHKAGIPYGPIDKKTGWPSSVPEGAGWRAALSSFMGDNSTEAFYAAVEATIVKEDGTIASVDELYAAVSAITDDAAETAATTTVDQTSCDFRTGPRKACEASLLGCGSEDPDSVGAGPGYVSAAGPAAAPVGLLGLGLLSLAAAALF